MSPQDSDLPLPIASRLKQSQQAFEEAQQVYHRKIIQIQSRQPDMQAVHQALIDQVPIAIDAIKKTLLKEQLKSISFKAALKLTGLKQTFTLAPWIAYAYFAYILYTFGPISYLRQYGIDTMITYLPSATIGLTMLLLFWAPYIYLVRKSRYLQAKQELAIKYQALDTVFGKATLQVIGFCTTHSDSAEFPNEAFTYPEINQTETKQQIATSCFRLGKTPGQFLGAAVFRFMHNPEKGNKASMWLIQTTQRSELSVEGDAILTAEKRFPAYFEELFKQHAHAIRITAELTLDLAIADRQRQEAKKILAATENLANIWATIALPAEVSDKLIKLTELFASPSEISPTGILLYGPPGTGKTIIAEALAKTAGVHFQRVSESDLKGQHQGTTAPKVKALFEEARKKSPCILFVDECEGVFKQRGGDSSNKINFDEELIKEFFIQWGGSAQSSGRIMVIGATNLRDGIDSAILSRFTSVIEIGLPDNNCRDKILRNELAKAQMIAPDDLKAVIRETSGMSGRDLHQLVVSIAAEMSGRNNPEAKQLLSEIRRLRGKNSSDVHDLSWDDIVLPTTVKSQFINLGKMLRNSEELKKNGIETPRGALLWGPPGTGKTQLARVLANESSLAFLTASTAELKQSTIGSSGNAVRALFERARSQSPCILFIDELEILAPARGDGSSNSATEEIIGQLLQEMDGARTHQGHVFVLAASNLPDQIDSAILSRLEQRMELPLPDLIGRQAILKSLLRKKPIVFDIDSASISLSKMTEGKSGRDLRTLIEVAARKATERALLSDDDIHHEHNPIQIFLEDITTQLENGKQSTKVQQLSWDDIVLPAPLRTQFETLGKLIRNSEQLRSNGIDAPRSALLWGPPGTGKTQLARVLANESGLSFFAATTADLKQKFLGHSGDAVKKIFDKARSQSPCILFIDEIEILAPSRGNSSSNTMSEEIIGQLLQEMDGAKSQQGQVFVLAASNHPNLIDSAVLSRFVQKIELPLPDLAARIAIFTTLLRNKPIVFDLESACQYLAELTDGKSGRDLRSIIELAANQATTRAIIQGGDIDASTNPIRIEMQDVMNAVQPERNAA